ncbi:unnamed protein product [Adineta steineri]|uniref:Secreted protein n=1 Tax=Adineta steineri TaxID=433720 RepID=A0A814J210_9BILA|nr:unnamed protein product [Adineta steineri]
MVCEPEFAVIISGLLSLFTSATATDCGTAPTASAIVLITFQDMYQFCLDNFFYRWGVFLGQRRVEPAFTVAHGRTIGLTRRVGTIQTVDPNSTVQHVARNPRRTAV